LAVYRLLLFALGSSFLWTATQAFRGLPAPLTSGPDGAVGPFFPLWASPTDAIWVGIGAVGLATLTFYFALRG
jgi:hypothetical protein